MPTLLRLKSIRRVALCTKGANQQAFVTLFKRDTSEEDAMEQADLEMVSDSVFVRLAKAFGFDPKKVKDTVEGAPADTAAAEAVAKQHADALAARDAEIKKRDDEIAKLKDGEQAKTFVAKAEKLPAMGKPELFAPVLQKISKALTAEEFKGFEEALTRLEAVAHASPLFKEIGVGGEVEGTATEKIQKLADQVAADTKKAGRQITKEQAYRDALHSEEGKKLYAEVRKADIDRYAGLRQEGD